MWDKGEDELMPSGKNKIFSEYNQNMVNYNPETQYMEQNGHLSGNNMGRSYYGKGF